MKREQLLLCSIIAILLIFTGCLERKETITVSNTGDVEILYELDGDARTFDNSCSYPTSERWDVREEKRSLDKDGKEKIKLIASQKITRGEQFPESFDSNTEGKYPLLFPSELKIWSEGNKTYYRFERTYQARMFKRFNAPDDISEDKELEERVLNMGIFNVPESDRNQYVENLTISMMYHTFSIYLEVVGDMIFHDQFPISKKYETEKKISDYIEQTFTDTVILKILSLDENKIDFAYDKLISDIESDVTEIISDMTDLDQRKVGSPFRTSLKKIESMYEITEALSSDKFSITLHLPGSVITTNGFTEPDEQGTVFWEFSGEDLHDAHIPLYALSVVEKK